MGAEGLSWNKKFILLPVLLVILAGGASALVSVIPSSISLGLCPVSYVPVNVTISGVDNAYGYQFDLSYNQSLLEFVNITDGGFLDSGVPCDFCYSYSSRPSSGLISNVFKTMIGSSGSSQSSGVMAKIVFRTKQAMHAPATTSIRILNLRLSDINSIPLDNSNSNSTITLTACLCVEGWACTSYSSCVDGLQSRVCTDNNYCGTDDDKPAESQNCTAGEEEDGGGGGEGSAGGSISLGNATGCVPSWACGDWSECMSTGFRTRSCSDTNSCNSTAAKPDTSEACGYSLAGGQQAQQSSPGQQASSQEENSLGYQQEQDDSFISVGGRLSPGSAGIILGLVAFILLVVFLVVHFAKKEKIHGTRGSHEKEAPAAGFALGQPGPAYDYVRECLARGYTLPQARDSLIKVGWELDEVDKVIKSFQ